MLLTLAALHPPCPQVRSKILSEEFGWDKELAKKIWCFGPDTTGALRRCLLVV